jgi:hypothetical protein
MGFFAQDGEETGDVVGAWNLVFGFDADEEGQRGIALQFFEAGIDDGVAKDDGQKERAPEDGDGKVVASFAARVAEGLEQGVIGDDFEEPANGLQGGRIFEQVPGKERLGNGDDLRDPRRKRMGRKTETVLHRYYATGTRMVYGMVEKSQKKSKSYLRGRYSSIILGGWPK